MFGVGRGMVVYLRDYKWDRFLVLKAGQLRGNANTKGGRKTVPETGPVYPPGYLGVALVSLPPPVRTCAEDSAHIKPGQDLRTILV